MLIVFFKIFFMKQICKQVEKVTVLRVSESSR